MLCVLAAGKQRQHDHPAGGPRRQAADRPRSGRAREEPGRAPREASAATDAADGRRRSDLHPYIAWRSTADAWYRIPGRRLAVAGARLQPPLQPPQARGLRVAAAARRRHTR